jgi:hypothetical protein
MYFDDITDEYNALATKLYEVVDEFDRKMGGKLPINVVYCASATLMLEAAVNRFPDEESFVKNMREAWNVALGKTKNNPKAMLN